jgi:hypothetical protein
MSDWPTVALTGVLVGVTAYYAWQNKRMVDEMAKTRSASVLLPVLEILLQSRRRFWEVREYLPNYGLWNQEQRNVANRLSLDLERIAYICEQGLLERRFVVEGYARLFTESWERLSGFVGSLGYSGVQPRPREHFERFAHECAEYLNQRGERTR